MKIPSDEPTRLNNINNMFKKKKEMHAKYGHSWFLKLYYKRHTTRNLKDRKLSSAATLKGKGREDSGQA